MIGNLRNILSIPTKVIGFINGVIRPKVMLDNRIALSDSLISDAYLITGLRVTFALDQAIDRFDVGGRSTEKLILEDHTLIKLAPSLKDSFTTCSNEQVDLNRGTATILQQSSMYSLRDSLNESHSKRFGLVSAKPGDRYFKAWYALELVGRNLLTNQEVVLSITHVYGYEGLSRQNVLFRVQSLEFEETLARYASGLNQII